MSQRRLLRFPGTRGGFADAFLELRRTLGECRTGTGTRYRCELVFEEIVTNIIRHAFSGAGAHHTIAVTLEVVGSNVVLEFEDDGQAFDPRCARIPCNSRSRGPVQTGCLIASQRQPAAIQRATAVVVRM